MKVITHKTCTKCDQLLDVSRFSKRSGRPSGLHSWCKSCAKPKDHCDCGNLKDVRSAACVNCRSRGSAACHPDRAHWAKEKCRQCYCREYQNTDGRARKYQLKHTFNLTLEEHYKIFTKQNGRCAICKVTEPGGQGDWHVDHDHQCCPGKRSCGKCVRGLLCQQCNHLLGNSKDDVTAEQNGMDSAYVNDLYALANEFEHWRKEHGSGDPDAPRHRTDDPATIEKMKQAKGS